MSKYDSKLAINGGTPVSKKPILIHKPFLNEDDFKAVYETTKSTFVSGDGPECREFEKRLAKFLGAKHVFFLNSATSALELAFRVKGFAEGSEVIVPNFTYTSTALGPLYNNLKIKLVDVYPDNGNIDVEKLEMAITEKTVAICPVDYAGNPADMDEVNRIAEKYGLYVVHDTAQSIGSEYQGRKTGTIAHVSTFSFHGTKNLTTGEGGALVTDDDDIAEKAKIMREKGTNKYSFLTDNVTKGYYEYVDIGNSYVQSNINGALGITQLEKLEEGNKKREKIADYYKAELNTLTNFRMLRVTKESKTNWHLFGILVPHHEKYWILDALRAEGINANVHYTPLHKNKFYKNLGDDSKFPGSAKFFAGLLRIPIYPSLTVSEQRDVIKALRKIHTAIAT